MSFTYRDPKSDNLSNMAYYAAAISLERTIKHLLDSSHIFILPSDREIINIDKKVDSLCQVLYELERRWKNIRSKRVESLREKIREAAYKLQDALDYHVSDRFLSRSEMLRGADSGSLTFSLDVTNEVLKQEINNFAALAEKIEDECSELIRYSLPNEGGGGEEEDDDDLSRICLDGRETKMVGLSDEFGHVKKELLKQGLRKYGAFTISGMAGIGKTIMAKKIYHDPEVCSHFNCRLWAQ